MTRPGARGPTADDRSSSELALILAGLGGEIRRPLESLRRGIDRLFADPSGAISEAERAQATTMLGLCDDLDRLTREFLEGDDRPIEA